MKKLKKVLYGIVLFLQTAAVIALFVAEDLTHKKAGVNHHLYYRRAQFNSTVLTENRILILTAVLIIAIAVLFFFLRKKKSSGTLLKVSCVMEIMWMAVTLAACYMDFFRRCYVYPYMMSVFALCILTSAVNIILSNKLK